MARIPKGIMGPFIGKVGPVVGSTWKSISYIKAAPNNAGMKKNYTAAQIANQQKFKFVSEWISVLYPFVSVGFISRYKTRTKTECNLAFSYNFHHAVQGTYPDLSIDYSKVMISKGSLTGLYMPQISLVSDDTVRLNWLQLPEEPVSYDDQLILVLYSPALAMADGFVGGAIRADEQYTFRFNSRMIGRPLEAYVGVTSLNRKKIADSVYLGRIGPL